MTSVTPKIPPIVSSLLPPASTDGRGLSSEEIVAFHRFVSQLDHFSTTPTSSFAHSGTFTSVLSALVNTPQCFWIIDLGASHHMIGMSFIHLLSCLF